jgi:hypothetical protein
LRQRIENGNRQIENAGKNDVLPASAISYFVHHTSYFKKTSNIVHQKRKSDNRRSVEAGCGMRYARNRHTARHFIRRSQYILQPTGNDNLEQKRRADFEKPKE